jgi:hypothetical protein
MRLCLPDLDPATRQYMLREFDSGQAGLPFVPAGLSAHGRSVWPTMMRNQRQGVIRTRRVSPAVTTASVGHRRSEPLSALTVSGMN